MTPVDQVRIVLASTSRYRGQLLARVVPQFEQLASGVDETPRRGESAAPLAMRLAAAKARAGAAQRAGTVVIGSDQAAELDGEPLGKPGDPEGARRQLRRASGRCVVFHTAVCLVDGRVSPAPALAGNDTTRVQFRDLDDGEIRRYVAREQPLDCAGSFKAEALGIALFERIESNDPTALIGLPLIVLCGLLRRAGIAVI